MVGLFNNAVPVMVIMGGGCNSLLLVETQDIYMTTHNVYFKGCYTFCCPVCGMENDIDSELLPYNVKKKIWEINGKYKIKKICR